MLPHPASARVARTVSVVRWRRFMTQSLALRPVGQLRRPGDLPAQHVARVEPRSGVGGWEVHGLRVARGCDIIRRVEAVEAEATCEETLTAPQSVPAISTQSWLP